MNVSLGESKIGFMISDQSHGYFVPKERKNPKTDSSGVTAHFQESIGWQSAVLPLKNFSPL